MARLLASLAIFSVFLLSLANGNPQPQSAFKSTAQLMMEKAQSLVNAVNSQQSRWKAEVNPRFAELTDEQVKKQFLGLKKDPEEHRKMLEELRKVKKSKIRSNVVLPDHFDAREHWPMCRDVISQIQDQSGCGSCWAVSTASVIQDRICIESNGRSKVNISAEDLMSCDNASDGCEGGYPDLAFRYWWQKGLCTGSNYTLKTGCKPYPYPPHPKREYFTQKCQIQCENKYYKTYRKDKHFAKSYTNMVHSDEYDIREAIMAGGPVEADMRVYADFMHYKSGVYQHTTGRVMGGHAVRIVGWGVDQKEAAPYWLVANSWNTDWGDKGYFKIVRGEDDSWIESWGTNYGKPDLMRKGSDF